MLQGKRLMLRAIEREDLPRLAAFDNDLAVELAGGGDPPMPRPLAFLVAEHEGRAAKGGRDGSHFVIEAAGAVIGICGLSHFDLWHRTCELGITIGDRAYWGRGYGREVVALLLGYAFRYHNMRKVFLRVWSNNERGIRAYRACGFVEEGRLREHVWSDGRYHDLIYMGVLRREWAGETPAGQTPVTE